jgi:mannose-6-phosphate isomerase-like protein (cupin superfamily)
LRTTAVVTPWHRGNAEADAHENRSWLVGHFKASDDIRYDEDVEVKVSSHPAGDERAEWSTGEWRRTFFMVMTGKWRLDLKLEDGDNTETVIAGPGDYVVWGPGVAHTYRAEADSTVITVRWPSVRPTPRRPPSRANLRSSGSLLPPDLR